MADASLGDADSGDAHNDPPPADADAASSDGAADALVQAPDGLADASDAPDQPSGGLDAGADVTVEGADVAVAGDVADAPAQLADSSEAGGPPTDPAPIGLAIVSSDLQSSALSLGKIDGSGLLRDECITSSTVSAKLATALSADVVLPTSAQPRHEVALIDRTNGTITWVDPQSCEVLRQTKTGVGFASRPQDVIAGLPDDKAYVPRNGSNPADAAEGGDVLIVDSRTGGLRGRIDLRSWAAPIAPSTDVYLPLPGRGLLFEGKVYLPLENLRADRMKGGLGRVVVIDPASDTVVAVVEIPESQDCKEVNLAEGLMHQPLLLVTCSGGFYEDDFHFPHVHGNAVYSLDPRQTPVGTTTIWGSTPFSNAQDQAPVNGVGAIPGEGVCVVRGSKSLMSYDEVRWYVLGANEQSSTFYVSAPYRNTVAIKSDLSRRLLYILDSANPPPSGTFGQYGQEPVHVFQFPVPAEGFVPGHRLNPEFIRAFKSNPAGGRMPRDLGFY